MAANLDADGGLIMAEALMMHLAPILGRHEAHDVVYDPSTEARMGGTTLGAAARRFLTERGLSEVSSNPADYLGEAEAIVTAAVERWNSTQRPPGAGPSSPQFDEPGSQPTEAAHFNRQQPRRSP